MTPLQLAKLMHARGIGCRWLPKDDLEGHLKVVGIVAGPLLAPPPIGRSALSWKVPLRFALASRDSTTEGEGHE